MDYSNSEIKYFISTNQFDFIAQSSKHLRNSDTVTMLVDIYGTRELFVNEYKALLADRLLTQFMDNLNDEIRFQEVLKLRLIFK